MSGPVMGSASLISQIPGDFLGLSASQWFWLAIAGWSLAIVLGGLLAARATQAGPRAAADGAGLERVDLDAPTLLEAIAPDEDTVGGVLRWLLSEVEADAVVLLELSPRGEKLRTEPRGLAGAAVGRLADLARRSLLGSAEDGAEIAAVRWLGAGGTKVLLATGTGMDEGVDEPLRFSRYLLEWVRTSERRERPHGELEDRLRGIPGVAWAEVADRSARLLATDEPSGELARQEVERELEGTGLVATWIGVAEPRAEVEAPPTEGAPEGEGPPELVELPEEVEGMGRQAEHIEAEPIGSEPLVSSALGTQEPRIRLLDVVLSVNGEATADVRVTWNEREIRGRGHGRATRAGRYFATAQAVADALRPLLDTEVVIEGLYVATTKEGVDVLISEVRMEGERYVGAVLERRDQPDWSGARAVLDAVNRRLVQLAGRSGRV